MERQEQIERVLCAECGKPFDSRKSLHGHIKSHGLSLGEYYVKFYPKSDLWTGQPIPFKNYETYSETNFRNKKNMHLWLCEATQEQRDAYCREALKTHFGKRGFPKFAPNYLYFLTHPRLPRIQFFSKEILETIGSIKVFTKGMKSLPDFSDVPSDLVIFYDTAEQKPLSFKFETKRVKLDFADYTLGGEDYSYVFVERKSEDDFKGTMSAGFDRFCRELDRARDFGAYVFIVVESDFQQIFRNNNLRHKRKVNLVFTWKRMRRIIADYSDVCQFVFTGSREKSQEIVPFLLYRGQNLKNIDLQFYLEEYKWRG